MNGVPACECRPKLFRRSFKLLDYRVHFVLSVFIFFTIALLYCFIYRLFIHIEGLQLRLLLVCLVRNWHPPQNSKYTRISKQTRL